MPTTAARVRGRPGAATGRPTRCPAGVTLLALVALVGCATPTPFDPFEVPREHFQDRVQTIAIAPFQAASGLLDDGRVEPELLVPLTERLRDAGYTIVGPEVWEGLWQRFARDIGPIYDPSTGRVDAERWEIVEGAVYSELAAAHRADAVLYSSLVLVDLLDTGSEARFCGAAEPVYWPAPQRPTATVLVRALCLQLALFDMEERNLYGIRTGLEVLETYAKQTRARRPITERLRDARRREQAIDRLVAPLVELRTASPQGER